LGADIVVHSATKYLGGHCDIIAGVVITKTKELGDQIKFYQNACGNVLGPFDSFLLIRGIETLHLRVKQHSQNAQVIAEFLTSHPAVDKVYYPGLKSHPDYKIAKRQMPGGFGGMLSFEVKGDPEKFLKRLKIIRKAVSLGGVESTIAQPVKTSHAKLTPAERKAAGISDKLLRFSVGVEDAADLMDDLNAAIG